MTRLEEHDLRIAKAKASNNNKRVNDLLNLIKNEVPYPLNIELIEKYRKLNK